MDGVYQQKDSYSVSGTTLTFDAAPANGAAIEVMSFTQTTINEPAANTVTPAKIAAGDFYFDTDTLYIDSTNNRVGIGTSSPAQSLEVIGRVYASSNEDINMDASANGHLRLDGNGYASAFALNTTGLHIYTNSASRGIIFGTDETERLRIDSSGNVGIGTTDPDQPLHVRGARPIRVERAGVGEFEISIDNTVTGDSLDFVIEPVSGSNSAGFQVRTRNTAGSLIEALNVNHDGNVGIGTTNPLTTFQVKVDTNKNLIVQNALSSTALKFLNDGGTAYTAGTINANTLAINADSGGKVGIGDSNPQHPLKVHLTNGEVAMFGSNGMNSPGQYAGIGLGQVLANNTTYQKVSLVTEGRNSGSYVQDFHILVDTAADPNSAVLSDAKLTIDGGTGAVTHPKQPSFNAYAPAVTSGSNTIIFQTERHDTGGDYNNSTGVFTAPVTGVYQFNFSILMDPGNDEYGRVLFRINDAASSMEQYGDNLTYVAGQPSYFGLGMSLVVYMAANDNIRVYNSGQWPTYGSSYGAFSGHLIG
jgi:hypothetical protein